MLDINFFVKPGGLDNNRSELNPAILDIAMNCGERIGLDAGDSLSMAYLTTHPGRPGLQVH